jgi:succinate dehydrogenase/fumarate reductase-like Fe-S protein
MREGGALGNQTHVKVTLRRYDPQISERPYDTEYDVPCFQGMSLLNALDFIYEQIDGSLAYCDHAACQHGICGQCTLLVNGKPSLMCQTLVEGDMVVAPLPNRRVVRDLVCAREREEP